MPAIPETMRAAVIERFGPPGVLKIQNLPVPEIDNDEVLIAVHTAGVGGWDAEMRGGWWPEGRPTFPLVLGTDGSGTVAKAGSHVRRFKLGDRVYAYNFPNPKGGFYAEYVAIAAPNVGHVPALLDLQQAGAACATGLTALQGVERLGAGKRDRIAIIGAAGGVGSLALQFALRVVEAVVVAVVKGKDALALARDLGANEVVDANKDDVDEEVARFAPEGLAGLLAFAGGETLRQCMTQVRNGGRVVHPNGVEPLPPKRRGVEVIGYDAEAGPAQFRRLGAAVEKARLKVPISASFPLAEAAKAHERIESGHVIGKIVLRVR
jgi:NADPH:quinone reductase-like Zn-dependent oxidoreductase